MPEENAVRGEDEARKAPTETEAAEKAAAEQEAMKAKDEAMAAKEKELHDKIAAEKAAGVEATKGAPDEGGAADPNVHPEAVPHPAVAEIEGVAASIGHVIDVSSADISGLPLRPIVVDRLGRIWGVSASADSTFLEYVGNLQR